MFIGVGSLMSRKILIIAPAWLGDMIMTHSLVQVLKERFADARFDVLAPESTLTITELMPEFTRRILMPDVHGQFSLRKRWQLARNLKKENYDLAYVLPNTWKSALVPFMARIPCRIGWFGESRYGLLTRYLKGPERYPQMVQRYVALGFLEGDFKTDSHFPFPKIEIPLDLRDQTVQKFSLNLERPNVLLSPGAAFGPAKRWPMEYFIDVARYFINQGVDVWVIGGPQEVDLISPLAGAVPEIKNFVGKTTLLEMGALIDLSHKVLSNDSGPMHIAAALNKPMIAIFGSSSSQFTPPLSVNARVLERLDLDCRPCFQRECPLIHFHCLKWIKPAQVIEALENIRR
jgi:heptosyltransferase-2